MHDDNVDRFIQLANDISQSIQYPSTDQWWRDVEDLTWALEETRRNIAGLKEFRASEVEFRVKDLFELVPDSWEEWPAFLVVMRKSGQPVPDFVRNYLPQIEDKDDRRQTADYLPQIEGGDIVSMWFSDPYMRSAAGSRHIHGTGKFATMATVPDSPSYRQAKQEAVSCLKSWVSFIEGFVKRSAGQQVTAPKDGFTMSCRWYTAAEVQAGLKRVNRPCSQNTVTKFIKEEIATGRIHRKGERGPLQIRSDLVDALQLES